MLRALCHALASVLEAPAARSLGAAVGSLVRLCQVTRDWEQQIMLAQHIWCALAACSCHACAACLPSTCLPCVPLRC
jgi:hypothetical protein